MKIKKSIYVLVFALLCCSACGKKVDESKNIGERTNQGVYKVERQELTDNVKEPASEESESNTIDNLNDNVTERESTDVENAAEAMGGHAENEEEPKESDEPEEVVTIDEISSVSEDLYVGEYNAYDIDEPGLQIEKNDDGTYRIQIQIYRLIQLEECLGKSTENGLVFSTNELGDKDISGTITVEDNVATVIFTGSDWSTYSEINEYKYYRILDSQNVNK